MVNWLILEMIYVFLMVSHIVIKISVLREL